MIGIVGPYSTGPAVGGAGVATANYDIPAAIMGRFIGAYIKYLDSPPAGTTDVTIATKGSLGPAMDLLKVSNSATNGIHLVKKQVEDTAGALIAGAYTAIPVHDFINLKIEQANANDSAEITLYFEEE